MQKKVLALFLVLITGLFAGLFTLTPAPQVQAAPLTQNYDTVIYFFWGDGCPHCAEAHPILREMVATTPGLKMVEYEVWNNQNNLNLLMEMGKAYSYEPKAVPNIIIGDKHWEGYNEIIKNEIDAQVQRCLTEGCDNPGAAVIETYGNKAEAVTITSEAQETVAPTPEVSPSPEATATPAPTEPQMINIPFIGPVNLNSQSLVISTLLIAAVDGFNPCSLWVLSILLSLTVHTGSRKKVLIIGLIFLTVTSFIYILFIAGIFTALSVVSFLGWIQAAVALISLFFAAVNIKDYFWYKEGLSFTIADEKKPGIYRNMRRVMNATDSFWAMAGATIALGAGVSLVEFACTSGFPVIWTNLLAAQKVEPVVFVLLLALYMIIYQIDELGIFLVAVFTLKSNKMEEKHGRILKLIGGTLMFTLAAVMLINPALMNQLESSLIIFAIAFLVAGLVLLVHRKILPRWGIVIGSEEILPEPSLMDNK